MISERRWDETGEEHFRETVRPPVWGSRGRQRVRVLVLTRLDSCHASALVLMRNVVDSSARCLHMIHVASVKFESMERLDNREVNTGRASFLISHNQISWQIEHRF